MKFMDHGTELPGFVKHRSPLRELTRGKNQKVGTNKTKGNFKYLWVGKVWEANKKLGFPRPFWIFWPLKFQIWPKMAKTILRGLEGQTKPFFHTELGPEYEFYTKDWNFECRKSNLAHFGPKLGQKLVQNDQKRIKRFTGPEKTTFPQFSALSMNFTLNVRILAVEGEI